MTSTHHHVERSRDAARSKTVKRFYGIVKDLFAALRMAMLLFRFNGSTLQRLTLRSVIFLQTSHLNFSFLERANTVRAGQRRADGGHDRNFGRERGISNHHFVLARNFPARRVDDEI